MTSRVATDLTSVAPGGEGGIDDFYVSGVEGEGVL